MFDFESNQVVKEIGSVPEEFRAFYAEDATEKGQYKLRLDDPVVGGSVKAFGGLTKSLKAARAEVAGLKGKSVDLSALGEYGASVEEIASGIRAKIDDLQGQLAEKGKVKIDLEKIKTDMAAASAKERGTLETRIKTLSSQLESLLVDNVIRTAVDGQVVDSDLIMPHVKARVRTLEEAGHFRVAVVDETGSLKANPATGEPMTIAELVKEMKASSKFAPLFKSETRSGSGTPAGAPATKVPVGSSSVDKIARGLAKAGVGGGSLV